MAYCAGVLGVHAVVYRDVVVDVKNVIGMLAVVMGMGPWFIEEWSIFAKRRGLDGETKSRVALLEVEY